MLESTSPWVRGDSEGGTVGVDGFLRAKPSRSLQPTPACTQDAGNGSQDQLCSSPKGSRRNTVVAEVPHPRGMPAAIGWQMDTAPGQQPSPVTGTVHGPHTQETSSRLPGTRSRVSPLLKSWWACSGPRHPILQLCSSAHSRESRDKKCSQGDPALLPLSLHRTVPIARLPNTWRLQQIPRGPTPAETAQDRPTALLGRGTARPRSVLPAELPSSGCLFWDGAETQ